MIDGLFRRDNDDDTIPVLTEVIAPGPVNAPEPEAASAPVALPEAPANLDPAPPAAPVPMIDQPTDHSFAAPTEPTPPAMQEPAASYVATPVDTTHSSADVLGPPTIDADSTPSVAGVTDTQPLSPTETQILFGSSDPKPTDTQRLPRFDDTQTAPSHYDTHAPQHFETAAFEMPPPERKSAVPPNATAPLNQPPKIMLTGDIDLAQFERRLREAVLKRLHPRIDPIIEHRVDSAVNEVMQAMLPTLREQLQTALSATLNDLVRRAISKELARMHAAQIKKTGG